MYYPCSENKDADQLWGYREADLHLCFRICIKKRFSHDTAPFNPVLQTVSIDCKTLIVLCDLFQ